MLAAAIFNNLPPHIKSLSDDINPTNAELNPIRHLLALVGARRIVNVSRIRVKHFKNTLYSLDEFYQVTSK